MKLLLRKCGICKFWYGTKHCWNCGAHRHNDGRHYNYKGIEMVRGEPSHYRTMENLMSLRELAE